MKGLCEVRLKKQGHLCILNNEKLILVCGRAVFQGQSKMLSLMLIT